LQFIMLLNKQDFDDFWNLFSVRYNSKKWRQRVW